MADKFLDRADMEEIKEEIKMTRLGQMLVEEALEEGQEKGEDNLARLAEALLNAGQTETLRRVLEDRDYRKKLLKQYGIE